VSEPASSDCCQASASAGTTSESPAQGLRFVRERCAPLGLAATALHQAILRAFAGTGGPPALPELQATAAAFDRPATPILADLHDCDVIRLDHAGDVIVAYPFSATPTRHLVRLADGTRVFAMCAIDALGIPAMLDTDAVITATDPTGDHTITIEIVGGRAAWNPAAAVVFVGVESGGGPSADCCCNYLNVFPDRPTAQSWADAHPRISGQILDPSDAERLGTDIFGTLLHPAPAA